MRTASPGMVTRAIIRAVALEILASPRLCCEAPQAATQLPFWAAAVAAASPRATGSVYRINTNRFAIWVLPARALLLALVSVTARHMNFVEICGRARAVRHELDLPVKKSRKRGVRLRHQLHFSLALQFGEQLTVSHRDFDDPGVRSLPPQILLP